MKRALIGLALFAIVLVSLPSAQAQFIGWRGWGYGGYYPRYGGYYYSQFYPSAYSYYGHYPYYGGYTYPRYYSGYYYPSTAYYYAPSTTYYADTYVPSTTTRSFYPPAEDSLRTLVTVRVPVSDAEVWIEGQRSQYQGTSHIFESPTLTPGYTYTYRIRARWNDNGRTVDQRREVNFEPGRNVIVDFTP